MSDVTAPTGVPAQAASAPVPTRSFFANLGGVLFSPREEFGHVLARPRFWIPLACWMAIGLAFTAVWLPKVDAREFMRNQIVSSGRADKVPPDQVEQQINAGAAFFKPIGWISAFMGPPIMLFAIAGIYLFVFRFFYGGEVSYPQSLTVMAWTFLALALVTTPLVGAVMALKGDWNINPQEALQASPAMFLDRTTTAKPIYTLAASFDLFTLWVLWLLSTGYGVATRRTTGSAAAGVVTVWVVYVLWKVAWSAIF